MGPAVEIVDELIAVAASGQASGHASGRGTEHQKQRLALKRRFEALSSAEQQAAEPRLIALLRDQRSDPVTRSWAPPFLAVTGSARARAALMTQLRAEKDDYVRLWIAKMLVRQFGGDDRIEQVLEIYDELERRSDRRDFMELLAEARSPLAVPKFIELLSDTRDNKIDDDDEVRSSAARGLAHLAGQAKEALPVLTRRLEAERVLSVSLEVIEAISNAGDSSCVPALLEVFGDTDKPYQIRVAILQALAGLVDGSEEVVGALLLGICDSNRVVAMTATDTLNSLLGADAGSRLAEFGLAVSEPNVLPRIADALRMIKGGAAIEYLEDVEGEAPRRQRAERLLELIGGRQAVSALLDQRLEALTQAKGRVQQFDDQALGLFKDTVAEARRGFKISLFMSVTIFAVGVILLGSSIYMIVAGEDTTRLWGAGTGLSGLGTILAMFYRGPLERVQQAVANLIQIEIAFLGYIRQVTQITAMFEREYLDAEDFGVAELERLLSYTERSMKETMPLVRKYAAPASKAEDALR